MVFIRHSEQLALRLEVWMLKNLFDRLQASSKERSADEINIDVSSALPSCILFILVRGDELVFGACTALSMKRQLMNFAHD